MLNQNEFGEKVTAKMLELFPKLKYDDMWMSFAFINALEDRFESSVDELAKEKIISKEEWELYRMKFFIDILESDIGVYFNEKFLKKFYCGLKKSGYYKKTFVGRPVKDENQAVEQFRLHILYTKIGRRMMTHLQKVNNFEFEKEKPFIHNYFEGLYFLYKKAIDELHQENIITANVFNEFQDKNFFKKLMEDCCFTIPLANIRFGYFFVECAEKYDWKWDRYIKYILDYEGPLDIPFDTETPIVPQYKTNLNTDSFYSKSYDYDVIINTPKVL